MPIIKDMKYFEFNETHEEFAVFRNGNMNYLFSEADEMTIVDIFKSGESFETSYIGSLSLFITEDERPIVDLASVAPSEQGKGVMTNLYSFLIEMYGVLISDTQMTTYASKMWNKLGKVYTLTEELCEDDMVEGPTRYVLRKK